MSCKKELESRDYLTWMSDPENGLRKDVVIGNFELSVMYQSTDYLLAREMTTTDNFNNVEKKKSYLGKRIIFSLELN